MPNTEAISKQLMKWAASRPDEVVYNPKEGYYSFDIVADAFEKGKDHLIEKMRLRFMENADAAVEVLKESFSMLSTLNILPLRVFIKNTVSEASILITVSETDFDSNAFIAEAYSFSASKEDSYSKKGLNFNLSFINDAPDLNVALIKSDGYSFNADLRD